MVVGQRQFAADADFAIGEDNGRKFGWGHWHKAALVRHCALTSLSCLPDELSREYLELWQRYAHNFPLRFLP